ncbi:unnamed protein product [Caenorhabditis sp. 36 PRJEB53466]|nr:unnamed protein product [Caenorhabditis sp. 36 PRJEB53466]
MTTTEKMSQPQPPPPPPPPTVMKLPLQCARGLNKFIALPSLPNSCVHKEDVLHRGSVMSLLRTKSSFFFLPDDISSLKYRPIFVTRHGYMIIYETDDSGLLVNLRSASHVICVTDRYKSPNRCYSRCHIKIRLPRGNIHLFVRNNEIHKWTCAINDAAASLPRIQWKKTSAASGASLKDVKTEEQEEILMMTAVEQETDVHECFPSAQEELFVVEQQEEPELQEEEESDHEEAPSPLTTPSVRSLRQKLESQLVMRTKEEVLAEQLRRPRQFVSSLFVPCSLAAVTEEPEKERDEEEHELSRVFSEERTVVLMATEQQKKEEEEEEEPRGLRKEWWMRSLRC